MRNNNYDTKQNGVAIEATYYMDTDTSRMNFEESIEIVQYSGYGTTGIGYYTDCGNVKGPDAVSFTVKGDITACKKWIETEYSFTAEELDTWSEDEIREYITDYAEPSLIDFALDRLFQFPAGSGLEIVPNKNLTTVSTSGYSQGDYAVVVYCADDLQECWGSPVDPNSVKKTIGHLYWDAPAYARIELNGENVPEWDDNAPNEYSFYDMPDYDEYDFNRYKFLAWVAEQSGVSLEELDAVFPNDPDYI